MACKAKQARATVFERANLCVPIRAAQNDRRYAGQRLGIINDRGAAPQSDDGRKRRPDAWNAALTFKRLHQRRFFSNFVCPRAAMPIHIEVVSTAENILAEEALRIGVFDRLLHDDRQVAILTANIDVSGMRADRDGGDHHAFDHSVRIMLEDQAILAGARLALIAIAQNIFRLG